MQKGEHEPESRSRKEGDGQVRHWDAPSNTFSCDAPPCLLACEIINASDTS